MSRDQQSTAMRMAIWGIVATVAVVAFALAVGTQGKRVKERSSSFLAGDPLHGKQLFRDRGCIRCHSVNGQGGNVGPDLGFRKPGEATPPQLVTAMWNHAPKMWERMHAEGISTPALSYEDVVQLLAYLSESRHVDGPGDAESGRRLFQSKKCVHCHAIHGQGGSKGPDLAEADGLSEPMEWSTSFWNHAPTMRQAMEKEGIAWPEFQQHEFMDLYAFARQNDAMQKHTLIGNPENGWHVFQQKSCAGCHSLRAAYHLEGPNLGPEQALPDTFIELGGLMANHAPQMENAMAERSIARPNLSAQEMTDAFAFLYSLRYTEPSGSPHVGASVFQWRGCSRCHGQNAEGTARAPALHGLSYNSINLAVALWRHGPRMQAKTGQVGIGWPTLTEDDVGDLLAFLNLPPEEHH